MKTWCHKLYLCSINPKHMFALTKINYNQDVFFLLAIISFLLLALIKGLYWKHSRLFFLGVFAQRYSNQYLREDNAFTERVNFLTFLFMVINFTLIILKLKEISDFGNIALMLILVSSFFLLKKTIILLLGFLFKASDLAKLTVFFSFLFDKTFGFVLFPIAILLYFFSFDISSFLLSACLFLAIVFLIFKLFSLWKIGVGSFGLPQVYIFLYLCILEIFPLLILGKGVFY